MIVRLGLPLAGGQLMREARALCAPLLVSAGAFARPIPRATRTTQALVAIMALRGASAAVEAPLAPKLARALRFTHAFQEPDSGIWEMRDADEGWPDIALDSAGFVAWKVHGGYPWPLGDYVALGCSWPWTWWSAPDACCEPEIATNADEVDYRVRWTAGALRATLQAVDEIHTLERGQRAAIGLDGPDPWTRDPMPILQGWRPEDYMRSAYWTEAVLAERERHWPRLVGVGSVCRRQVQGPTGLLAVVETLDAALPPHVQLHLFGVKSEALPELGRLGRRVASVDSQAWDRAARWEAGKAGVSCTMAVRREAMRTWWGEQQRALRGAVQLSLFDRRAA